MFSQYFLPNKCSLSEHKMLLLKKLYITNIVVL